MTLYNYAEFLAEQNKGLRIEEQLALSQYSTYKIGGPADCMAFPGNREQLARLLELCRVNNIPRLVIGNGSNILFSDLGFRGVIINLSYLCNNLVLLDDNRIQADAGVQLHELSLFALYHGLTGMEFCEGIPGTVGGALYMNAGAYGGNIGDHLESVLMLDEDGQERLLVRDEMSFSERSSRLQSEALIALHAVFALRKPPGQEWEGFKSIFEEMRRCIRLRRYFQPSLDDMGSPALAPQPSAGSVFGRIQGMPAHLESAPKYWIDRAGLKGMAVGQARVSDQHPNFIINTGGARAEDVRELIRRVKVSVESFVREQEGIKVHMAPEVICLDEYGQRIGVE